MNDKCNCYRFSPRDSLSGAVAQIADYLSKHPGWNETELRAFVDGFIIPTGVESFNDRTGAVILDKNDVNNLKIASAYFAKGDESINSLDLVSLYNQGVRFVFTDFNNETKSYNLSFVLDYSSDSGNVVYYPILAGSITGGNVVSVNGKTGNVELKVVDVSNGNSSDKNAYIFIDEAEDYPDIVAPDSNKLGGQNPQYYATAESVAGITPDDTVVDGKPWTSKKTVDSLCMPLGATGNPVQVYPVEGYPLVVKVSWEPVQEGEGDPSPENIRPISGRNAVRVTRCGKNLFDKNKISNSYWVDNNKFGDYNTIIKWENAGWCAYRILCEEGDWITVSGFPLYGGTTCAWTSDSAGDKYLSEAGNSIDVNKTYIAPAGAKCLVLSFAGKVNSPESYTDIALAQVEFGTVQTQYEPYTGSTTDIALPETVYGGEVDAVSGEGQERWKQITLNVDDMDGTDDFPGWNNQAWMFDVLPPNSDVDLFEKILTSMIPSNILRGSTKDNGQLYWVANGETQSEYKEKHAGKSIQICYKLATPAPFTAAGAQPIHALSGVNTIYTDAGTPTVTGREDPQHTIVELKNAIISLGGNV